MKILFISSGNTLSGISPIILNQGESLAKLGHNLDYYTIKGKGILGYLKNILLLKKFLKTNKFDIIHSHYALSSFVATLSGAKPQVASLMGSDVLDSAISRVFIKIFSAFFWKFTIVKSEEMKRVLNLKSLKVIPNGVDFENFKPISRETAINFLKWDSKKKHLLFAASKNRPEKNYELFNQAQLILKNNNIEIHTLEDVDHKLMPYLFNASDVIILTSKHEGSPNVIKEAMACNKPIISTNVGDVKEIFHNTKGCFIINNDPKELANEIENVLLNFINTNGRDNIEYLESSNVAKEIVNLYEKIINKCVE